MRHQFDLSLGMLIARKPGLLERFLKGQKGAHVGAENTDTILDPIHLILCLVMPIIIFRKQFNN